MPNETEIQFPASDGKSVYADLYKAPGTATKKVVLMFHQAGSNAGEYEAIAPQVNPLGYDCIAVDQRSGGDMWGKSNRTVDKSGSGDYLAAYNDLVGALNYAKSKKYSHIVAWGSSYSASLVFRLAAENPGVDAVLSFSPGEYMDDKSAVRGWASRVSVPVLFACTPDEWSDGRSQLYDALKSRVKVKAVFDGGVHGSSTLIDDKSKAALQYMEKVRAFLKGVAVNVDKLHAATGYVDPVQTRRNGLGPK